MDRLFIAKIVAMANRNRDLDFNGVARVIADNDVVFGVWPDDADPLGVGFRILKGERLLAGMVLTDTKSVRLSAVACIDGNQAEAARQILGEGDLISEYGLADGAHRMLH